MGIAPSATSFFEYGADFVVEEAGYYYLRIKNDWEKTCGDMDERVWQEEIEAMEPKIFYLLEFEMEDYSQSELGQGNGATGNLEENSSEKSEGVLGEGGRIKLLGGIFLGLVGLVLMFFAGRFFLRRREIGQLEDLLGNKDVPSKKPTDNFGNNLGIDQGNNLEKKLENNFSGNDNSFSEKKEDFLDKKEFGRNARPDFFSGNDKNQLP